MQWEGPAEVPVDLILFRWINFHLGKVLLPRLRLAPPRPPCDCRSDGAPHCALAVLQRA